MRCAALLPTVVVRGAHTQERYAYGSTSTHPPATTSSVAVASAARNPGRPSRTRVVPPNATLLSLRRERAGLVPPVTSTLFHAQYSSAMRMLDDDLRGRSDGRLNRRERVEKGKREVQSKAETLRRNEPVTQREDHLGE